MSRKRWGFPPIVGPRLVRILKEPWWGHKEGIVEGERYYPRIHATKYQVVFPGGSKAEFLREELEVLSETPYAEEGIGMAGRMRRKRWGERQKGGLIEDGKFHTIYEGAYYYATLPEWIVEMDGEPIQLAVLLNMMDAREIDEHPDESYPFSIEMGLLPAYPGPVYLMEVEKSGEPSGDPGERLYNVERYSGTVPITDLLLEEMADDPAIDSFSARKMKWVVMKAEHGTVAARKGQGTTFEYPQFRDVKTALEFSNILLRAVPVLFEAGIEGVLEEPINMKGDTGWNEIYEKIR